MGKINVRLVLEILGRPPEHISSAIVGIVEKLGAEKGVKVVEKKFHDPIPVEGSKDLFTTFTEVSLELDSMLDYIKIIFGYMPSHIEVVSPESLDLGNGDFNEIGNTILQRLHHYDALTKGLVNDRAALATKLKEVAPHLFQNSDPAQVKENLPSPPQQTAPQEKSDDKKSKKKKSKAKKSKA